MEQLLRQLIEWANLLQVFLESTALPVSYVLEISGMDMRRTMSGTPSHIGKGLLQGASVMAGSLAEGTCNER